MVPLVNAIAAGCPAIIKVGSNRPRSSDTLVIVDVWPSTLP